MKARQFRNGNVRWDELSLTRYMIVTVLRWPLFPVSGADWPVWLKTWCVYVISTSFLRCLSFLMSNVRFYTQPFIWQHQYAVGLRVLTSYSRLITGVKVDYHPTKMLILSGGNHCILRLLSRGCTFSFFHLVAPPEVRSFLFNPS